MPDDQSLCGRQDRNAHEQLYFYGEEMEWCWRAWRNGFESLRSFPTPEVIHIGRASTTGSAKEYIEKTAVQRSLLFYDKTCGRRRATLQCASAGALYPVSAALLSVLGRKEYAHILTGWALQARKEFLALRKRLYPAGMKKASE